MPDPTLSDINGFDRGYMLGFIHALEQTYLALTGGDTGGAVLLDPKAQADRMLELIAAAREEFNETYQEG